MRYLAIFMTIFLLFGMQAPEVLAKKFGGGGSFGKHFRTAPKQPSSMQNQQRKQQTAPPQRGMNKRGMMGGLLGGLLAGGLLASLFAGGAFEGLQMADILIIAAIAFAIMWFLRRRRQQQSQAGPSSSQPPPFGRPEAATAGGQQRQVPEDFTRASSSSADGFSPGAASATDDIPFNVPQGFDVDNFLEGARGHYNVLQKAWNENNLSIMEEYVSAEVYRVLIDERRALTSDPQTQVLFVNAELVRADQVFGEACLSVRYSGRCRELSDGSEEEINEVWHLERKLNEPDAPWLIVGIQND